MLKLSEYAENLKKAGYTINFEALPEELSFCVEMQECMTDEEIKNYTGEWFCAEISITFCGITSDCEYLGGCAYNAIEDFTGTNNCYFDDMLKTCVENLSCNILTAYSLLNL